MAKCLKGVAKQILNIPRGVPIHDGNQYGSSKKLELGIIVKLQAASGVLQIKHTAHKKIEYVAQMIKIISQKQKAVLQVNVPRHCKFM